MTVQLWRTRLEYWLTLFEQRMAIAELGDASALHQFCTSFDSDSVQ